MKRLWGLISIIALLFISACTSEPQTFDPSEFSYTDTITRQTFVVQKQDGYAMQSFVVKDESFSEEERHRLFEQKKQDKENADEYFTKQKAWSKPRWTKGGEQRRLEDFCEEAGFDHCIKVRYTCEDVNRYDDIQCHRVFIECDDALFDPKRIYKRGEYDPDHECRNYEVEIEDDSFDLRDLEDGKVNLTGAGFQIQKLRGYENFTIDWYDRYVR